MRLPLISFFILYAGISMGQQVPTDPNATLLKTGTGYAFTEGASCDRNGNVFFTDQPNDKIYTWNEKDGIRLFKDGAERANGTEFDTKGNLIICADINNSILKIDAKGKINSVYNKGYSGKYLNGPNDLWIDQSGGIYFTDPYYYRDYWEAGHTMQQDAQAVYYLKPEGELVRVVSDLKQPNGIAGTPDGKFLYVADIAAGKTYRYKILPDGKLAEKTLFANAGSDGMTTDEKGNVYLTYGKVQVFNSRGEKLGDIDLPENPSNLCFGGKNHNILFITARTSVYTIKMNVKGF
ncbi:MAG TPA: SMP-30/gluconolactonase/LRE family protein [Bacteroidales bacterium]|nr:SMP-30/gluconolactonase/LRE family protein [Bacteroidales bacterium]